jgi:penicillin-binding protein 1C
LAFEDQHFYKHPGFNPVSLVQALRQNMASKRVVRGGSTLTQQVIRLSRKGPERSYSEKVVEMILATRLEFRHSKEEILNLYASHAPFGGNVVGLEMASWRYFGVQPHQLSWAEAATLAVLPNAPALIYPGKNQKRLLEKRNRLLKKNTRKRGFRRDYLCFGS